MWIRHGGDLRSFAKGMRCDRGYRKSYGRRRRSWRGGMGSPRRRGCWAWTGRAFRSGRIDWNLALPQGRQRHRQVGSGAPAFVELLAQTAGATFDRSETSCLVEVESPQGAKLRLEVKAIGTSALAELIRAFAAL